MLLVIQEIRIEEQHNFINNNNQVVHCMIESAEKGPGLASLSKQISVCEKDAVQLKEYAYMLKSLVRANNLVKFCSNIAKVAMSRNATFPSKR